MSSDQGRRVKAVVARVNAVDEVGDVFLPGALPAGGARVKLSSYAHRTVASGESPVGDGVVTEEDGALLLRGRHFDTAGGREAFNLLAELGPDAEWSVSFRPPVKTAALTPGWRSRGARRLIAGVQLVEASPVLTGACGPSCGTVWFDPAGLNPDGKGVTHLETKAFRMAASACCDLALFEQNQAAAARDGPSDLVEVKALYIAADRDLLLKALDAGVRDLAISGDVRIRFFKEPRTSLGRFYPSWPDTVWLRSDLDNWRALEVLAHELKHLQAHQRGYRASESEAEAYGERLKRSDPAYWPRAVEARWYNSAGMAW